MKRAMLGVLVLAVCGILVAPVAMAGGKPSGSGGKTSTLSLDFVAGPTSGQWSSGVHWTIPYVTQAQNVEPGGPIDIYNVPSTISESGAISWDTHGEDIISFDSNGDWLGLTRLKQGTYYAPDTKIAHLHLSVTLDGYVMPDDSIVTLHIRLNMDEFGENQQVKIEVGKSTVTISGADIPFDYVDFSESSEDEAWMLHDDVTHDFTFVIDK